MLAAFVVLKRQIVDKGGRFIPVLIANVIYDGRSIHVPYSPQQGAAIPSHSRGLYTLLAALQPF